MNFPPAPMPPPPPHGMNQGPWDDVPFGDSPPPGGHGGHDFHDDDLIGIVEPKKDKKKKKEDKGPVEVKFEAYSLEKAPPRHGEKLSWARVGKRVLPFEDKKLANMVKTHQNRTRRNAETDFGNLTSNQQGVINRLILERKQNESNKNADWVLVDVQKFGVYKWRSTEIKKIQVILKRHGKDQMKAGEHTASGGANSYHDFDIIDIADPIEKKDKKAKKQKSLDDLRDLTLLDDLGPPPAPNHGHGGHGGHGPHRDPWDLNPGPPPPPPPQGLPPPPIDHHFQQPHFQPQFQPQFQPPVQPPFNGNPFQPHPQFAAPGQFESPPMNGTEFPHMHRRESARRRSQSRPRQQSARRRSSSAKRRSDKVRDWRDNSSQETYDDDSVFSHGPDDRSFTPPSSPRSGFSEAMPRGRGSLSRHNSTSRPKYQSRSNRYRDLEIEPHYTYREEGRRYSRDAGRYDRRASVHQDDYPPGGAAVPRYLPAPEPPRRLPRRITYDGGYDYNDFDDMRRLRDMEALRRRSTIDPLEEAYEAGRRASYRGGGGYFH